MSRMNNAGDNTVIESFFSTPTYERFSSPDGAQRSIAERIDAFYNARRRHTSLRAMSTIKHGLSCQMRKRRTQPLG